MIDLTEVDPAGRYVGTPRRLSRNHLLGAIFALLDELVGHHCKTAELRRTECGRNSHVRGVPAPRDHDASNPRMIVTRIEGEPAAVKKYLEPCAEIHRRGIAGHPDVAKVTGAISGRNIHAAAERDRQMSEVATNTYPFLVALGRYPVTSGMVVSEFDANMNVIADCLNPLPAAADPAEQRPCLIRKFLCIAISASQ